MKRMCEPILYLILSILLIFEPIVLAKEETKKEVIIKKVDIIQSWLTFKKIYKTIINETNDKGLGKYYDNNIIILDEFIHNSQDIKISYNNLDYLKNFFDKAVKSISQYLPINLSQIDVASENLPGLFIKQIMGLIAPFFTIVGGGIFLISMSILTFIAVPSIPFMLVLALIAGVIGLILGIIIGIPAALVIGLISLTGSSSDQSTKATAFTGNLISISKLNEGISIYNDLFNTEYKYTSQDCITTAAQPIITVIGNFVNQIINWVTNIINIGLQSGAFGDMLLTFGGSTIFVPIVLIFAALFVGFIIVSLFASPFLLPIVFTIALGISIAGIGLALFNSSNKTLSSNYKTYYDVIALSITKIKGDPLKNLDIIAKDILDFSEDIFGESSASYINKLKSIILSYDLKTENGIKEATFEILDFIPQIR
jgi:hypothetical protein